MSTEEATKPIEEATRNNEDKSDPKEHQHVDSHRRCGQHLANRFPRMTTICCRILVPLVSLIVLAAFFGLCLAKLEAPGEFDQNDQVVARLHVLDKLPVNETISLIGELPAWCFAQLVHDGNETINATDISIQPLSREAQPLYQEAIQLVKGTQDIFQNDQIVNYATNALDGIYTHQWPLWWEEWLDDSLSFMLECGYQVEYFVRQLIDLNQRIYEATSSGPSLTFNWIRCWNTSSTGAFVVWNPTEEMLDSAATQNEFYSMVWLANQEHLFQLYLDELGDGANLTEKALAWESSIMDATGRNGCVENIGGTAWFWFTVMTTVGYGNQAPSSRGGRLIITTFGFLSIIAFAGVLAIAGKVVDVIFKDLVTRSRFSRCLARHSVGVLIWGVIAISWMYLLGARAGIWWKKRLGIDTTDSDQFWFGYISSTTVGLGDYFLQPQVMFLKDVFSFSVIYLSGFVFTSLFLSNLGSLLEAWLPSITPHTLIKTLAQTNVLAQQAPVKAIEELEHANSLSKQAPEKVIEELEHTHILKTKSHTEGDLPAVVVSDIDLPAEGDSSNHRAELEDDSKQA